MDFPLILEIASVAISFFLFISTVKINRNQSKKYKQEQAPNLLIRKINFIKGDFHNITPDKYIRYYYGPQTKSKAQLSLESISGERLIPLQELTNDKDIAEIQSHKNSAYLTQFNNQPCLFINLIDDVNSFIVEHHNTEVVLYNTGAPILSMSVNYAEITYTNGRVRRLKGFNENFLSHIIETNDSFSLSFNEVSNNFNDSVCQFDENTYKDLPDVFDLLSIRFDKHFLHYKKLDFCISITDVHNHQSSCNIILECKGDYLVQKTQPVKSPLFPIKKHFYIKHTKKVRE